MIPENSQRTALLQYAQIQFGTDPEYPWQNDSDSAVLRQIGNDKWYGLFLVVPYHRLGINQTGSTDLLNVKCDPLAIGSLMQKPGCLPAYHMNKRHWLSLLLDGTLPLTELQFFLAESFQRTAVKRRK